MVNQYTHLYLLFNRRSTTRLRTAWSKVGFTTFVAGLCMLLTLTATAQLPPRQPKPRRDDAQRNDARRRAAVETATVDSARQAAQERADSVRGVRNAPRRPTVRWTDRYTNRFSQPTPRSPYLLRDPRSVSTDFRLDRAAGGGLIIQEQLRPGQSGGSVATSGNVVATTPGSTTLPGAATAPPGPGVQYRPAETLPFSTYNQLQNERVRQNLWREYGARRDGQSALSGRGLFPKLNLPPAVDRIFGSSLADIRPNGFVTLDLGYLHQFIDNPALPVRTRRQGNLIFNEQISLNMNAKIGDRLGFLTNFDTKASFNFENALRLNYKTPEESIIQKVEVGNLSWPLNSQLIPGVQNLFGFKTQLKFGRLNATVLLSQQRSRQETIVLRGGVSNRPYEIRADQYDENRHFFLSQFFRENYERSLRNLPQVTSGVLVTRVEVYVTNRTNTTDALRNIVGFQDLGESRPFNANNPNLQPIVAGQPTDNGTNGLFARLKTNPALRQVNQTATTLEGTFGFQRGSDYDLLRGAKRLTDREFRLQPELGYISLLTPLRNDEVLAVSYEYTFRGRKYKVGELVEDYQDKRDDEVLFLKMLKSSTIRNNLQLPMWDLMMKNIYSLNTQQLVRQNFQLRIIYKDDLTGIDNPNLQEGERMRNRQLVEVFGLDELNQQLDRQPDGNFDYVENVTVDSRAGRVIFPVLEPFGSFLQRQFLPTEQALIDKYVFDELYDLTLVDAQQITTKNKFFLRGSFQSSTGQEVALPYGVNEQSVQVAAGGVPLMPGQDFVIDGQIGRLRILNESVLNSGREVRITYERPDLFQNQVRTLFGTRLDYQLNPDVNLGLTAMRLRETPAGFLTRVAIGNEPVNNTLIGVDANIRKDARFLTNLLDRLPLLQTKELSTVQFQGEVAQLLPGMAPRVNNRSFIDDFEAARTIFDLTRQPTRWRLGATPLQFNQGSLTNPLPYAYNRAEMSVYSVDLSFYGLEGSRNVQTNLTREERQNVYERGFLPIELFPNRSQRLGQLNEPTLDVLYIPTERGMFNYNPNLTADGQLPNPRRNFGAVTRAVTSDNDFDNANVENITFWMLDPFVQGENGRVRIGPDNSQNRNNTTGGKLVFNLGDISEDVVRDGRFGFENGLPADDNVVGPTLGRGVDTTAWGRVTREQFVTNAFINQPGARERQDVGLDGLSNVAERSFFQSYLNAVRTRVTNPAVRQRIENDPSNDDFLFYLGPQADSAKYIVARYRRFLGMENNAPEITGRLAEVAPAATTLPDIEDLNTDNTINETDAYYEYEIDLRPGQLDVGKGYIIDKVTVPAENVVGGTVTWYQFRVPVRQPTRRVGNINGFKSIRFMRMYLTDFEQPVVLRFAQLQMEANSYRRFLGDLNNRGRPEGPEPYDAQFKVAAVNVEENGSEVAGANNKYIYTVPPGYQRDQDFTQLAGNAGQVFLNEQSMSLSVVGLRDGDVRSAFRNTNFDFLFRKRLKMNVHMHTDDTDGADVAMFMRIGTDFTDNYYEIEIPRLTPTPRGTNDPLAVWPVENNLDLALDELVDLKANRNRAGGRSDVRPFTQPSADGRYNLTVVGNPDFSSVQLVMIGMRNPRSSDEQAKSFTIWVNELVAEGFDQRAGTAAVGALNAKLADFATLTASGRFSTFGFGGVQTRVGERSRDATTEYGVASAIAVDKLLPEKWGFRIPLYVNFDRRRVAPQFNPLDPDTPLRTSLSTLGSDAERSEYRRLVEDNSLRRGINFSNVRKVKTDPNAKLHFWDFENFAFTYAMSETRRTNVLTQEFTQRQVRGGINYTFSSQPKPFEPFRNVASLERKYLLWLKDFNLTLLPTLVSIRTDVDRSFIKTQLRNSELDTTGMRPLFEKFFLFNRYYDLTWNLTRNLVVAYRGQANAIIDEPFGDVNTQAARDSIWTNIRRLGRMKNFQQDITTTYRVPLDKFPALDWIQTDANYRVGYQFQANAFGIADTSNIPFGNIIRNNREYGLSGRVDLIRLYNKFANLRRANTPSVTRKNYARSPGDVEEIQRSESRVLKSFTRALLTVRGINFTYTIQESTILPGFLPSVGLLGMARGGSQAPGLPFVLGAQNRNFQYYAAERGWVSASPEQNQPFTQTYARRFNARTTLEPFRDFRAQVEVNYTRADSYQEFFRPGVPGGPFESQSPVRNGQFSMSYLSFRTSFVRLRRDNSSPIFERFREFRDDIIRRLNEANPNVVEGVGQYNLNSQDVLIPAFFAAYSGKSVNRVKLSPFYNFPLPNWRVDYNGLSNLPLFKKTFSSFILAHSYTSTYSVGNFTSALDYGAQFVNLAVMGYPLAAAVTATDRQFIPVFVMSTITMSERFAPLLGVQFQTRSRVTGRLEYNRQRDVALNLSNSQVAEFNNNALTASVGFTRQNFRIPFRIRGAYRKLKNDLNFQCAVTFNDTRAIQRKLDAEHIVTAGNINFQLRPQVSYVVNRRVNLNFYFDRTFNDPLVSNFSFRRATTSGGVQLRFNLAE